MGKKYFRANALETLLLALVPLGLNFLYPQDPGFYRYSGFPYLILGMVVAGFYGVTWGLAQLLAGSVAGFLLVPWVFGLLGWGSPVWRPGDLGVSVPLSVAGLLVFGLFRHRREVFRKRILGRMKNSVRKTAVLQREVSGLLRINEVLEDRVVNQKDSITMLRNQVKKLATLNLAQALETLLETVRLFTEMTSGSVYVLNAESKTLVAAATLGWDEAAEYPWEQDPDRSVVGYVFRNGKPFSIRMMLEAQEFTAFTPDNNLLTFPIKVKGRVWGVLNIEKIPFERYSLYTESVLEIILTLVEPFLVDILNYEMVYRMNESDPATGIPLVTQLFQTLDKELDRRDQDQAPLSLVLIEISNFDSLAETTSRTEVKKLFLKIKKGLDAIHKTKSRIFHFKNDHQLAVLVSGLDQDGTSFFCLELLALVPGLDLTLGGKSVDLELIIGFSSTYNGPVTSDVLVQAAENLLALQRL